ncbi:MAG: glycosyltransferase family 4 protein [Chitinophagales bacterium]|nr:glycosyltransferase family 4 protein [Chitinophagales bacterium]
MLSNFSKYFIALHSGYNKLTIAFDAKRLFNNYTGLGNYSRSLVRYLQQKFPEHDYHLFTPKAQKNEETAYFFDPEKFTIHTPPAFKPLWRTVGMAAQINNLKPDIFHGLSHEIPFGIHRDIATVVTFHDLIYELYPKQFGWWDRKMYQLKYRSSARRAAYITAVSKSTLLDLSRLYHLDASKMEVHYQSCNEVFLGNSEMSSADRALFPLDIKEYYLYVGSIIERKGLLLIIDALAQLPNSLRKPLVVVGKGDLKYLTQVKNRIKHHQLESYVHFIQGMSNEALVQIYDQSFCLIYPSVYEGFGIPVIESLFRKKPVITSNLSSLPEAAGPGAILIDPYSVSELVQAMQDMSDSRRYNELAQQGHNYVQSNFSPQQTTHAIHDYYQKILQEKNSTN